MERRESADEKFLGASVATACVGRTVLQSPLDTNVSSAQEHKKVYQIGHFTIGCVTNFE